MGLVLVILVSGMIVSSRWGKFLRNYRAVEAVEANEVAEAAGVNEAAVISKAWKITIESSLFLNSTIWGLKYFSLVFWKKIKIDRIMKTDVKFSVGGFWGQPMLLFWKLVDETQMPWPQEYTDTFKQNLACIFLSVRVNSKETFQCETPCMIFKSFTHSIKISRWIRVWTIVRKSQRIKSTPLIA